MSTTTTNDTTSHGNHLPQRVDRAVPFYYQQFSEMADANRRTSRTRRLLVPDSSRLNETAGPDDQASAPATADQADCIKKESTACEEEGSLFYLFHNDSDDGDYFQQLTSEPTSPEIDPAPKRLCRRRRERRSYPKESHIIAVAKDVLALIDHDDE